MTTDVAQAEFTRDPVWGPMSHPARATIDSPPMPMTATALWEIASSVVCGS